MSDRCSIKAARIRELNDQLRCKAIGGRIVITRGIEALGGDGVRNVLAAVAKFDDFTEDNDPWGEHDCAVLTVDGRRIIFKIDLYEDPEVKGAKETPNNASAAGGIGSCGIILDAGAAENALRPWKRALYWAFQGRFLDQDRVRA